MDGRRCSSGSGSETCVIYLRPPSKVCSDIRRGAWRKSRRPSAPSAQHHQASHSSLRYLALCPISGHLRKGDLIAKIARWQNLIPSFPWIAPGWRAWGSNFAIWQPCSQTQSSFNGSFVKPSLAFGFGSRSSGPKATKEAAAAAERNPQAEAARR